MSHSTRNSVGLAAAAGVLALGAGLVMPALAATAANTPGGVTAYQGKIVNQHVVLGPQSAPSVLVKTATLPPGRYLVTATVGAVISAHDQIVCAAYPAGAGNDGVFGTAGNPGTGGIYGTATMTDTVRLTTRRPIEITCNSFNYGLGTYAGSAVVEAVPVNTLTTH